MEKVKCLNCGSENCTRYFLDRKDIEKENLVNGVKHFICKDCRSVFPKKEK